MKMFNKHYNIKNITPTTIKKNNVPPILFCFCLPSYHPREFIKDLVHMHAASYDRVVLVIYLLL